MMTTHQALDVLAKAYRCDDVSLTEAIAVIQKDARKRGMLDCIEISKILDPKDRTSIRKVMMDNAKNL